VSRPSQVTSDVDVVEQFEPRLRDREEGQFEYTSIIPLEISRVVLLGTLIIVRHLAQKHFTASS
jgi:hypothetical protein